MSKRSNLIMVNFETRSIWKAVGRPAASDWDGPQSPDEWIEYMNVCLDSDEEPVGLPDDLDL